MNGSPSESETEPPKKHCSRPGISLLWGALAALCLALYFWGPPPLRWPARILFPITLVLTLFAFVRDSHLLIDWVAQRVPRLGAPWKRWFGCGCWQWTEKILALAVVLVGIVHLGQMLNTMARSSLREDEIGTIAGYSSRGPITTMTRYNLAKNHIFFNLANSVTPGSTSYHPLRARLWSFVAVVATLGIAGGYFVRRQHYAEAALVVGLLGLNGTQLGISLEARGYGFLLLAATLAALALPDFLRNPTGKARWILGVSAVLGTYTIPSYIVFGGLLLLICWLLRPRREVFATGWFAAGAIFLLYLPVLSQLRTVASAYDDQYGQLFGDLKRLEHALRYVIPDDLVSFTDWSLVLSVALLLMLPILFGVGRKLQTQCAWLLFGMCAVYYSFCLWLKTPPDRVTAFLAGPIAVALAYFLIEIRARFSGMRALLGSLLCAALLWFGLRQIQQFSYEPPQRWSDTCTFIRTLLPPGTHVWADKSRESLHRIYLEPAYPVEVGETDLKAYRVGALAIHDSEDHDAEATSLLASDRAIQISFPAQRRTTSLWFIRPQAAGLHVLRKEESLATLIDGDAESGVVVEGRTELLLEPDSGTHSIVLQGDFDWKKEAGNLQVKASDSVTGKPLKVEFAFEGTTLVVHPVGSATAKLQIAFTPQSPDSHLTEAWAMPMR